MKMNELKLIYFSPTGTTHKVVMETARSIDLNQSLLTLRYKKIMKPVAKFCAKRFCPVCDPRILRSCSGALSQIS